MRRTWLVYGCWVLLAALVGAGWGLWRGLSYLPTLWAAALEGGFLFAVPTAVVGLLPVGCALLAHSGKTAALTGPVGESASGVR